MSDTLQIRRRLARIVADLSRLSAIASTQGLTVQQRMTFNSLQNEGNELMRQLQFVLGTRRSSKPLRRKRRTKRT